MDNLRNKLRQELVAHFGVKAPVDDDAKLFSGGLIDSLSVMDLVFFVEAELGCSIPPADINLINFDSVSSIVRFAGELTEQGGGM